MPTERVEIDVKGKFFLTDSIRVNDKIFVLTGRRLRFAALKDEWFEDVVDPELAVSALKSLPAKPDIFTFWQRLPDTKPKYNYYMEWDNVAAIPIKTFRHWLDKQVRPATRNKVRKAERQGVVVRQAAFDDDFIKGMVSIFNETPIRQDRRFWHYGKDFATVKREFSRNLFREDLIGAYYDNELIGFVMLAYADQYAVLGQIISKIAHRDKAPNNALIAKAVEACASSAIPYLVYANWSTGALGDFKRYNGFQKIDIPRYYIPLTLRGSLALKLRLHHGLRGLLPPIAIRFLRRLRSQWYYRTLTQTSF